LTVAADAIDAELTSSAAIARYLDSTGGKFTDTVEREIEERL
jgi:hypothetical protein